MWQGPTKIIYADDSIHFHTLWKSNQIFWNTFIIIHWSELFFSSKIEENINSIHLLAAATQSLYKTTGFFCICNLNFIAKTEAVFLNMELSKKKKSYLVNDFSGRGSIHVVPETHYGKTITDCRQASFQSSVTFLLEAEGSGAGANLAWGADIVVYTAADQKQS